MKHLTPAEAHEYLQSHPQAVLIDCRTEMEFFYVGHPVGAVHVPWHEPPAAQLRFLPPYSPDFNPIEMAFAKLKGFLRAARPRTFDEVVDLVKTALALFLPDECANYFRHAGYRLTEQM